MPTPILFPFHQRWDQPNLEILVRMCISIIDIKDNYIMHTSKKSLCLLLSHWEDQLITPAHEWIER